MLWRVVWIAFFHVTYERIYDFIGSCGSIDYYPEIIVFYRKCHKEY